ncbi:10346_t:CDS:2, partial [Entrophospora sp. SA101]
RLPPYFLSVKMRSYLNLESPESWSLDSFGKWCLDKENFNGEKSKIIGYMRKELEVTSDNLFLDQDVRAKAALLLDDLKDYIRHELIQSRITLYMLIVYSIRYVGIIPKRQYKDVVLSYPLPTAAHLGDYSHGQVENVNVSTKHSSESTQPIVIENENLNVDGIQSHADGGLDVDESEKSDITKEWIVDSINVTSKFREYQKQIIESLKKNKKLTWNNAFELLALCSIIILTWPCPYSTFTSSEWIKIIGLNPYKLKQPILPDSLSNFLSHALNDLVLGLDVNFISNDGELGEIAANAFNNFKDKIPVSFDKKITEKVESYFIDLKYDGLYRAWSFLNTQLVVNQQSLPLLVSTLSHFISIE